MITAPFLPQASTWFKASEISKFASKRVAVAWSGGIDSTALLLALHSLSIPVQAWHIDHGWHRQSADDALRLQTQAELWGLPFFSKRLPQAPQSNREAEARHGRYAALAELASEHCIQTVLLGHHADDQAETVFMRMLQGSGVMGCCGMQAELYRHGLLIQRPLLHVRRAALKAALQQASVPYLEDQSNMDTTLWRNRLRLQMFPRMQTEGFEPYHLFLRWQKQAERIAEEVQQAVGRVSMQHSESSCAVNWRQWSALSTSIRAYVLQDMAAKLLGDGKVLGRRHIELIEVWRLHVLAGGGLGGLDLSGCHVMIKADCLHLEFAKASCRI
ncbi:MAG: tRNA lysidine(34) synthetase TilS [Mariprofundaceae bacterium]